MALRTPKTASTRVSLSLAVAGTEPANAAIGTLSFATDTDLVRVMTSVGWTDVGAGGGGTVTEIDSPDNTITVTNSTGPVVSLVVNTTASVAPFVLKDVTQYTQITAPGLGALVYLYNSSTPRYSEAGDLPIAGNVTGKLRDVDVVAITETSGPTTLTFGAITSGQMLLCSGANIIGASPYVYGPAEVLHKCPRVTPNALDDDFTSGSADLATRGWTVIDGFAGTTMTRSGDVVPYDPPTSIAAGNYRSTITPYGLIVQARQGVEMFVYKAVSNTAATISAVVAMSVAPTTTYYTALEMRANQVVINNSTMRWHVRAYNASTDIVTMNTNQGYVTRASLGDGTTIGAQEPTCWTLGYLPGGASPGVTGTAHHIASMRRGINYTATTTFNTTVTLGYAGFLVSSNNSDGLAWTQISHFKYYAQWAAFPGITP